MSDAGSLTRWLFYYVTWLTLHPAGHLGEPGVRHFGEVRPAGLRGDGHGHVQEGRGPAYRRLQQVGARGLVLVMEYW